MSVVTNEDKITGRGKKLIPNPVKIFAQDKKIKIIEVLRIDDSVFEKLKTITFECFVIVSFGHIIPKKIIELAGDNIINVHPSLLPEYRGPSPVTTALLEGRQKTGISIMRINESLDEGPVYAQTLFRIDDCDNKDILEKKLIKFGAPLLNSVIELISIKLIKTFSQTGKPSYTRLFKKDDFVIDWSANSQAIINKIRAFSPEPGAQTGFRDKKIKILCASPVSGQDSFSEEKKQDITPRKGKIITADKAGGVIVLCGNNEAVKLLELKPEGKNKISGHDFINGYRVRPGEYFY